MNNINEIVYNKKTLEGRYANTCQVGFNEVEFVFDFGQVYEAMVDEFFHTRIVTSPLYMKHFSKALNQSLYDYENKYGRIPFFHD